MSISKMSLKPYVSVIAIILGLMGLILSSEATYIAIKAEVAQVLLEQSWQATRNQGTPVPPWPWADTSALAKLEFIRQQQTHIILSGSSGRTLAFAPGHLTGSSKPGEDGHIIISAHRDTHFKVLEQVQIGDRLQMETQGGLHQNYRVTETYIVDSRYEPLILDSDSNKLTLITCFPFDALEAGSPYRYRVDAIQI